MDYTAHLKEHHVKPSYTRIKILDYMVTRKNHPTVDMIYGELSKELPTLSKTTVYNTMDLFLENGVIQLIGIDEKETRYDADISVHAHFKCDKCGKIIDLFFDEPLPGIKGLEGLKVREVQYYVKGLCDQCE